jgi:hypothetical protein
MPTIPASNEKKRAWAGSRWKAAFGFEKRPDDRLPSEPSRKRISYSNDLKGLLDLIQFVSRRVLANRFLNGWMVWASWILAGVIVGGAVSRRLAGVVFGAVAVAVAGGLVTLTRAWFNRPSAYALACKVDAASGLQDRLSTALYLGASDRTDAMVLRQRRDALSRLSEVDPGGLFPFRMPSFASRTLVLALIAAGLLVYRAYYRAPILALVQGAANSRVEKAVISPLVGAVKKDLLALVNREPEVQQAAADAETVPGLPDAKNGDDPSDANKNGMTPDGDWDEDSQAGNTGEPADLGDPESGDADAQGQGQDASQAADAPQNQQSADANQSSQGENGNERAGEQQQGGEQQSAANSMLQALKNLMKNMAGQSSNSPGESGGQPSAAGSSQQAGNSPGQGAKSDSSKDSDQKDSGSSPGSKKPGGGAGNGSTPVPKQAPKTTPPPPKNTVPDRVDLEANNFRQQGRTRTTSAVGAAQLPLRDIKPQPVAAIKGAEQENIPVRYRLYVQRYFEHTEKAPE